MIIKVLKKKKSGACLHIWDPKTDMPACNSQIKREDWEVVEIDSRDWLQLDWHCYTCPWTDEAIKELQGI